MSFTGLLTRTGNIHPYTASTKDHRGNATPSYGTPIPTAYYLEQQTRDEQLVSRDTRITTYLLVVPAATPLSARDRFEDDNAAIYEVDGEPAEICNPRTSQIHHIEATLRKISG